jgi:hypothetical protein
MARSRSPGLETAPCSALAIETRGGKWAGRGALVHAITNSRDSGNTGQLGFGHPKKPMA